MTNGPEGDARAARNERREAARQRARRARTQQKRRQRGTRLGLGIGLGAVLLAAVAVVTLVLVDSTGPAGPGPSTMSQGGITIGQGLQPVGASASASASPSPSTTEASDPVRITMYVDYLCDTCAQFEQANGDYIASLVDSGAATVDVHPVAVLTNRSQGTKYSLRAANAAACVADRSPGQFWAVNQALFAEQPEQGTSGLTDAQLTRVVTGVSGVRNGSAIRKCIEDQTFAKWVDERSTAVAGGDIPGSSLDTFPGPPLVLVNGKQYELTSPITNDDFRTFVVSAAGATESTPTPTPSVSPTPSESPSASAG